MSPLEGWLLRRRAINSQVCPESEAVCVQCQVVVARVKAETAHAPVSEYGDATAATNAARERARRFTEVTVLLHDRYGRVRRVTGIARPKAS